MRQKPYLAKPRNRSYLAAEVQFVSQWVSERKGIYHCEALAETKNKVTDKSICYISIITKTHVHCSIVIRRKFVVFFDPVEHRFTTHHSDRRKRALRYRNGHFPMFTLKRKINNVCQTARLFHKPKGMTGKVNRGFSAESNRLLRRLTLWKK